MNFYSSSLVFIIIETESCRAAEKFPKINMTCSKFFFAVSYRISFTKSKPSPLSKVLLTVKEVVLIIHFRELYLTSLNACVNTVWLERPSIFI